MTKTIAISLIFSTFVFAKLPEGQKPTPITLSGEQGGLVAGGEWSSDTISGKTYVLFYVDPDESDLNEHVSKALKREEFSKESFGSIAVINMAASWKPNFAINAVLKDKQESYPSTIYVRDMNRALVKKWNLKDESSNVVLFDKDGVVRFSVDGKLSADQTEVLIARIKELTKAKTPKKYGSPITLDSTQPLKAVLAAANKFAETEMLTTGLVKNVCKKKGCWMIIEDGGEEVRVKFKGYKYFVPLSINNKQVRLQGIMETKTISVSEQRHYLEDEGRPQAEIDAITKPAKKFTLIASGVEVIGVRPRAPTVPTH